MFVQTISGVNDKEAVSKLTDIIQELGIKKIRINLCKLLETDVGDYTDKVLNPLLLNSKDMTFFFDIPFPKNKKRVIGFGFDGIVVKNEKYMISNQDEVSHFDNGIYVDGSEVFAHLEDDILYYGDGEGAFELIGKNEKWIEVRALNNFYIKCGKSLSLPLNETLVTDWIPFFKRASLEKNNTISILSSFVGNKNDIEEIRNYISNEVSILAKIETEEGIRNISEIAEASDGVVIARGDLAIQTDPSKFLDKLITISKAVKAIDKELCCATDILNHINERMIPERAELVDILVMKELGVQTFILPGTKTDELFSGVKDSESKIFSEIGNRKLFLENILDNGGIYDLFRP